MFHAYNECCRRSLTVDRTFAFIKELSICKMYSYSFFYQKEIYLHANSPLKSYNEISIQLLYNTMLHTKWFPTYLDRCMSFQVSPCSKICTTLYVTFEGLLATVDLCMWIQGTYLNKTCSTSFTFERSFTGVNSGVFH